MPTANAGYPLSDRGYMFLTVAEDADRTGRRYDGPMSPGHVVPAAAAGASDSPDDPVVQAAVGWLDYQQACASANRGTSR